jgi:hypothetical protein
MQSLTANAAPVKADPRSQTFDDWCSARGIDYPALDASDAPGAFDQLADLEDEYDRECQAALDAEVEAAAGQPDPWLEALATKVGRRPTTADVHAECEREQEAAIRDQLTAAGADASEIACAVARRRWSLHVEAQVLATTGGHYTDQVRPEQVAERARLRKSPRPDYSRGDIPGALQHADFDGADAKATVAKVEARAAWWRDRFNAQHCVLLNQGGRCVVAWRMPSEIDPKASVLSLQSAEQFQAAWRPYVDAVAINWERDNETRESEPTHEYKPVAAWWLGDRGRREAISAVFRPACDEPYPDGHMNTWTGFGVEPRTPGPTVRAFLRFVTEVIASGNQSHARYIRRWIAWTIQNRGQRAGVALVLRGAKGTGKNTLLDAIRDVWGSHGMTVTQPEHVTGKFNAHLADKCFLFSNEAIPPADKVAESALKGLITDPTRPVERKGIDTVDGPNYLNLALATNESWAVPATPGERRFAVFDVSSSKKGDAAYWTRIHGLRASGDLLGELLGWALSVRLPRDWHPRAHVPETSALADQIFRGLRGESRAVANMLMTGEAIGAAKYEDGRVFISTRLFVDALGKGPEFEAAYGRELAKCCGEGATSERKRIGGVQHRGYWVPALGAARANWAKAVGFRNVEWAAVDGWLNPLATDD